MSEKRKSSVADHPKGAKAGDGLALDAKQGIKQVHSHGSEMAGKGHVKGSGGLARILEPEKNEDRCYTADAPPPTPMRIIF